MVVTFIKDDKEQYNTNRIDQDGLWKKVIGDLFDEFLLFFIPALHEHIDFSKKPVFLDKELFQEVSDEQKGRRFADRLAKVYLKNGEERWILIHIEVQSKNETEFPKRMFQYFYRIFDRYDKKVVALVVDTSSNNPEILSQFDYNYFGTKLNYSYNTCKITDFTDEELKSSEKLFGLIILAAKMLHQTKNELHQRFLFKRKLMRLIINNHQYTRMDIQASLHFIDYLLQLPKRYTEQLSNDIRPIIRKETKLMELYNKENASPTFKNVFDIEFERGIEQGMEQGIEQGIERGAEQVKNEVTKKLLLNKLPFETIMDITGLSLAEVEKIKQTLNS